MIPAQPADSRVERLLHGRELRRIENTRQTDNPVLLESGDDLGDHWALSKVRLV